MKTQYVGIQLLILENATALTYVSHPSIKKGHTQENTS